MLKWLKHCSVLGYMYRSHTSLQFGLRYIMGLSYKVSVKLCVFFVDLCVIAIYNYYTK